MTNMRYLLFSLIAFGIVLIAGGCRRTATPPPGEAMQLPAPGSDTLTSLKVGDPFPELELQDLGGNTFALTRDQLGEKATLVLFWSTWCGYCMSELPHEIVLANKYAGEGLKVIGITADQTPEAVKQAEQELNIPWVNLYEGPHKTVSRELGIHSWPTLFLLDANGKIISSSPYLRMVGIETLPDGKTQQVFGLDWSLEHVLKM